MIIVLTSQCYFTDDIELMYVKCLVLCVAHCKKLISTHFYYLTGGLL